MQLVLRKNVYLENFKYAKSFGSLAGSCYHIEYFSDDSDVSVFIHFITNFALEIPLNVNHVYIFCFGNRFSQMFISLQSLLVGRLR